MTKVYKHKQKGYYKPSARWVEVFTDDKGTLFDFRESEDRPLGRIWWTHAHISNMLEEVKPLRKLERWGIVWVINTNPSEIRFHSSYENKEDAEKSASAFGENITILDIIKIEWKEKEND